jgi:hypothetical protein
MTQATQQADPWATASQAATAATEAAKPADPNADPFASPDEIGPGESGPRGPKLPEILGRLVILKPIELLVNQPTKNDEGGFQKNDDGTDKLQDIYVCSLTVLGPDDVTVYSAERTKDGKTYSASTETFKTPFTWERYYIYNVGIIYKLKGLEKAKKSMLLGVVQRCPTGTGYKAGETWETTAKKWADYRAAVVAGRDPAKPQFSWGLVDETAEQRAIALAWYRGQ